MWGNESPLTPHCATLSTAPHSDVASWIFALSHSVSFGPLSASDKTCCARSLSSAASGTHSTHDTCATQQPLSSPGAFMKAKPSLQKKVSVVDPSLTVMVPGLRALTSCEWLFESVISPSAPGIETESTGLL